MNDRLGSLHRASTLVLSTVMVLIGIALVVVTLVKGGGPLSRGVLFGVLVGILLGLLASPLIALSPSGLPAVPSVRVIVPWLELGVQILVVVVVLLAVVAAVARGQRSSNPANILREADNG